MNLIDTVEDWVIDARRYLHSIPETAFEEFKTSAFITEKLTEIGYKPETGLAITGVIALLDTKREGPTIMLRADIDALNMTEKTGLSFSSTHEGKAHACGHDAHVSMLLGAAKVLYSLKEQLKGRILFVFQPAEEGFGGAQLLLKEGLFERFKVDYVFGQHVWPSLPLGTLGIKEGKLMAAVNRFDITIKGKGGHGAIPHHAVDALEVGTQVVSALQRLVSRKLNPQEPSVVTIGSFHAGTAFNIIPETAEIIGTTRTFSYDIWRSWGEKLEKIVNGVCQSMDAEYTFTIDEGYPPLINNKDATIIAEKAAIKLVSSENVVEPEPSMGGEDMAFYHEQVKGCFIFLGCGGEGVAQIHNPQFTVPEEVLSRGVSVHCQLIMDLLGL